MRDRDAMRGGSRRDVEELLEQLVPGVDRGGVPVSECSWAARGNEEVSPALAEYLASTRRLDSGGYRCRISAILYQRFCAHHGNV